MRAACGRVRRNIKGIRDLAPLMHSVALGAGVNSEAFNLAGPAADVEQWSHRKVAAMKGSAWHVSLIEDDDEMHPYSVLTRWQMMLSEDYGHERPARMTTIGAADYLDGILGKVAQDESQEFALLAREVRKCYQHLEAVLRDSGRRRAWRPVSRVRRG